MSQANGTTAPSISVYGYHLESLLGSGGIAHVYLGRASSSRTRPQLVAIKVVPLSLAASSSIQDKQEQEQAKKKARKEFQIHDVLKHSHILRLFKADELQAFSGFPTGFYVALEFAPGGDLFDKISEPYLHSLASSPLAEPMSRFITAPDAGVDEEVAHLYFYQLINGIVRDAAILLSTLTVNADVESLHGRNTSRTRASATAISSLRTSCSAPQVGGSVDISSVYQSADVLDSSQAT